MLHTTLQSHKTTYSSFERFKKPSLAIKSLILFEYIPAALAFENGAYIHALSLS
jgi:hypothetical protein